MVPLQGTQTLCVPVPPAGHSRLSLPWRLPKRSFQQKKRWNFLERLQKNRKVTVVQGLPKTIFDFKILKNPFYPMKLKKPSFKKIPELGSHEV
jgi:hypothetical protein